MRQEDKQAPPTNRIWTIASDPKITEYAVQINATGDRFERIAAAVFGILLFLLLMFILPASSQKTAAKLLDLHKQESDLERKAKKLELKKEVRLETIDLRKQVTGSTFYHTTGRDSTQCVKSFKSAEKKVNHQKSVTRINEKLLASIQVLLKLKEELCTASEKPVPERVNELKKLRGAVKAELGTLEKLEAEENIDKESLTSAVGQAIDIFSSVKLDLGILQSAINREKLIASNKTLLKLEEEILSESQNSIPDKLNVLKNLRDTVEAELGTLQKLEAEENIDKASLRSATAQATAIFTSVKLEIVKLRKEALSSRKLPLDFLGLIGISYGGLTEAQLPVLYLPILWSFLLFSFLCYWIASRSSMVNLYARLFRRALGIHEGLTPLPDRLKTFLEANAEELLSAQKCKWWWLAPLPKLDGRFLRGDEFRAAIGWTKVHRAKVFQVTLTAALLILLQLTVLYSGTTIIEVSEDVTNAWILGAVEFLFAIGNISLVILALFSIDRVPDFGTNQEEGATLNRRTFLCLALVGIVLAPLAYQFFGNQCSRVLRNNGRDVFRPYFRRRKPHRFTIAIGLGEGFYLNPRRHIIHYLGMKESISSSIELRHKNPQGKKRRREPFKSRAERTLYRARVAAWRFHGERLDARPRRQLRKQGIADITLCQEPTKTGNRALRRPIDNLDTSRMAFRGAGHLKQERLKKLTADTVLSELQRRKVIAVGLADNRKFKMEPPIARLNSKGFVFAVQEAVSQILRESPENIDYACKFLFVAIEARGSTIHTLRLFDFLAALSYRHGKKEWFEKILNKAEEYGGIGYNIAEFAERAERWKNSEGKWQQRWAPNTPNPNALRRDKWASLPM